jgi:hypothetical protein
MGIFYVDPVNGNDANAGTSWGTAWRTFFNGPTNPRINAGDTIKVAKSPDPVVLTNNVTWTNASLTIQITGQKLIDVVDNCESGWTSGLVIPSYQSANYRQGSYSMSLPSNATTGVMAYKSLSTKDYSAYTRLSLWIRFTANFDATASNRFSLNFCSDGAGSTVVKSVNLPLWYYPANQWVTVTVDVPGGIGSGINSIAIYDAGGAASSIFYIDNITVSGDFSNGTSLSLTDLIAKNDGKGRYFPITYLDYTGGNTVIGVGGVVNPATAATSAASTAGHWDNAGTETVETVKRTCIDVQRMQYVGATTKVNNASAVAPFYANDSGTSPSALISFIGGYNTSTDTIDGETWFDVYTGNGRGFDISAAAYLNLENFGIVRAASGIYGGTTMTTSKGNNISVVGCVATDVYLANYNSNLEIFNRSWIFKWIFSTASTLLTTNGNASQACECDNPAQGLTIEIKNSFINNTGIFQFGTGTYFKISDTCIVTLSVSNVIAAADAYSRARGEINNLLYGVTTSNGSSTITNVFATSSSSADYPSIIKVTGKIGPCNGSGVYVKSIPLYGGYLILDGNGAGILRSGTSGTGDLVNWGTNNATPKTIVKNMNVQGVINASATNLYRQKLVFENFNNTAKDHRIYYSQIKNATSYWRFQNTTKRTGTYAWEAYVADAASAYVDLILPIADVACKSTGMVTARIWVRRTTTNLPVKFYVFGGTLKGVNYNEVTASGSANTWEELVLTFTPTEAGLAKIMVSTYYTTTAGSVFVDDFSITQA